MVSQLALCRAQIAMWMAMVKARTGKTISSCLICRLMVKADYTAVSGLTLKMAQTNLKGGYAIIISLNNKQAHIKLHS